MIIKVFIADDHAVVRDGLKALLQAELDLNVVGAAADGRQAVSRVENLKPDVVLMDISMPELNGIEATVQIIENNPEVKVIILSMHESTEYIYRVLRAGALGYLLKETAGKELVAAIRVVFRGKRYLSQRIEERMIDDYVARRGKSASLSPLESLSAREMEILQLVVEGKSSAEIARILFISPKTVETHRSRLMQKMGIKNIPDLVKFAISHGIISVERTD